MQPSNAMHCLKLTKLAIQCPLVIEVVHKGFLVSKVSVPLLRALLHPGQEGYIRLIMVLQHGHDLAQTPKDGLQGPCAMLCQQILQPSALHMPVAELGSG